MHYHIMALATDSISVWLCYEVKYSMLLRLKESGQVSDSDVHGSLNIKAILLNVDYTQITYNKSSVQLSSMGGW